MRAAQTFIHLIIAVVLGRPMPLEGRGSDILWKIGVELLQGKGDLQLLFEVDVRPPRPLLKITTVSQLLHSVEVELRGSLLYFG